MVKTVFVDLKKKHYFYWVAALFFPYFWQKNVPKKVGLKKLPLFLNFEKVCPSNAD